jgi:hypothetical protein
MKKLFIAFVLLLGLASLQATDSKSSITTSENSTEVKACNYGQCKAIAKSTGQQCKHCVSKSGDRYCWQHR